MNNYGCVVHFHSPASAVYAALTSEQGLRGWWTKSCTVGTALGEVSEFEFDATLCAMKIVRLEPDQKVEWRCTQHALDAPDEVARGDEWVGTTLKFHLSETPDGGSELWFQHAGMTEALDCYEISNDMWEFYVCTSLREYVDTGTGRPFDPGANAADDA